MLFHQVIRIGRFVISQQSRTFIIAEAGVNHNGNIRTAKQLIDIAVNSGADAVKFQAFKTEHLVLKHAGKAAYQLKTTPSHETQFKMLKKLEMTTKDLMMLKDYCEKRGIMFLVTPFERYSLDALDVVDLPAYKVSSTDITNVPYLRFIAQKQKPIILSTGAAFYSDVRLALQTIHPMNKDVILMQCTANYPVKDDEVNLNVIETYRKKFNILVGYSDHSYGIGAAPYAVAKGAKIIEKHFTQSKNLTGPDHRASLNPTELEKMVKEIRKVEHYLGSSMKELTESERETRKYVQKYLVAARGIQKGEFFTKENIVVKRTGREGLSPHYYDRLMGIKAKRDYLKNEMID